MEVAPAVASEVAVELLISYFKIIIIIIKEVIIVAAIDCKEVTGILDWK